MSERVLVVGKGAREHALAYRLSRDPSDKVIREVLICPGNDGTAFTQACMRPSVDGFAGIAGIAKKLRPSLIVIGPEEPLSQGLADALVYEGFHVFGPSQKAAQIEASKTFMKELAMAAHIPTAAYKVFDKVESALEYCETAKYPLVIKADGLCAGKGVVVAHTPQQASAAVRTHCSAGSIVIEDFLSGTEMSVIGLCTENDVLLFAPVRDHKRLLDNDQGPNTGGMGVVGPLPELSKQGFMSGVKEKIFLPALAHMKKLGCPFRGALFAGLMVDNDDVRLLEFNARFGDPETQALMFGTSVDMYPLLLEVARGGTLSSFKEDALLGMMPTAAITMAARGYPDAPISGDVINIGDRMPDDSVIFFAGVSRKGDGQLATDGGRILSCTARAETLRMAIHKSYDIVANISFFGAQYRADIGRTLL